MIGINKQVIEAKTSTSKMIKMIIDNSGIPSVTVYDKTLFSDGTESINDNPMMIGYSPTDTLDIINPLDGTVVKEITHLTE
jgi:hypothetical protein